MYDVPIYTYSRAPCRAFQPKGEKLLVKHSNRFLPRSLMANSLGRAY